MKAIRCVFIFIIFLTIGCVNKTPQQQQEKESLPTHKGEINIKGAYALMPLVQRWITEYQKIHPLVLFNLSPVGSGEVLSEIYSDKTDLLMISSELPDKLESAVWILPVAKLSVVMIVNKKNPYWSQILEAGIKKDDMSKLFTGEITSWGNLFGEPGKQPVSVYFRSDQAGATDILSKFLWLDDQKMSGTGILGENQLIEAIKGDSLAIGYCNFIYSFDPESKEFRDDIGIIPLDLNQNGSLDMKENFYENFTELQRAMWLGKYPCILNRPLQFVASQKPSTKELYDFLKWTIIDGQKIVPEMGYMELRSSEIQRCLSYIEN
ncbi:PstS family phosphate ABC transporter substrate-binding protein [Labilibaculum antarcticum]|uniref:Phosphate ABC transporter substrate-binding protein n=1 Tax=Labilibaculum antarcticum TaxID=1717717 RepID=A0A1Y1CES9_9BACT|nr:substrate-binding domain-containing protein [Labilibaculum antarcticum]BAX78869.1 phosphate ABC transporter substrate-binding protein [Labilibaculum antarcticum]